MTTPILSVIVPDCEEQEQTKITLRLLRLYTDPQKIKVFAVSSPGSASAAYLRQLKWVDAVESAGNAFPEELFSRIDTPYTMVLQTGVACLRADWYDYLMGHFDSAGPDGVKCCELTVFRPFLQRCFCRAGAFFRQLFKKEKLSSGEICRCLVCRSGLLPGCVETSPAGRFSFGKGIDQESVLPLPRRETDKFFCFIDNQSADKEKMIPLPSRFCDILDAGELDL